MGSIVSSNSAAVMGMGVSLPVRRVTSAELDQKFGWKQGKLERLCGVRQRPVVSADETQESMGAQAAIAALADAGIAASELDLLLFAAAVGRQPIPATAPLIKRELGLARENFPAFDVNAT
ncbi:MAG: hypothetical protein V3V03_10245, partial [Hyphomonadaceae bacterium]